MAISVSIEKLLLNPREKESTALIHRPSSINKFDLFFSFLHLFFERFRSRANAFSPIRPTIFRSDDLKIYIRNRLNKMNKNGLRIDKFLCDLFFFSHTHTAQIQLILIHLIYIFVIFLPLNRLNFVVFILDCFDSSGNQQYKRHNNKLCTFLTLCLDYNN